MGRPRYDCPLPSVYHPEKPLSLLRGRKAPCSGDGGCKGLPTQQFSTSARAGITGLQPCEGIGPSFNALLSLP